MILSWAEEMVDPLGMPEPERNGERVSFAESASDLAAQVANFESVLLANTAGMLVFLSDESKALP